MRPSATSRRAGVNFRIHARDPRCLTLLTTSKPKKRAFRVPWEKREGWSGEARRPWSPWCRSSGGLDHQYVRIQFSVTTTEVPNDRDALRKRPFAAQQSLDGIVRSRLEPQGGGKRNLIGALTLAAQEEV